MHWIDPRQPYEYCFSYDLTDATLAELIGLDHLETLAELLRNTDRLRRQRLRNCPLSLINQFVVRVAA